MRSTRDDSSADSPASQTRGAREEIGAPTETDDADRLRKERDFYWSKLEGVAKAIDSDNPLRIIHDVRNVMNELVLLRKLADFDNDD